MARTFVMLLFSAGITCECASDMLPIVNLKGVVDGLKLKSGFLKARSADKPKAENDIANLISQRIN